MKKLFIILLIFNYTLLINAQSAVKWSKELKSNQAATGGGIYADLKGNAYGTANYDQYINLGAGYTYSASGSYKPMLVFGVDTSNGNPTWVSEIKPIAGCGCNYGVKINLTLTDNTGNLIIAGYFCNCGTMAFGTQTLSALSHQTFLAKYSKTGQLLWVKTKADVNNGSSTADNYIQSMTTDEFDNIYLSIRSKLNATFAGMNIDKGNYLIKLNSNGNAIWSKQTWDYNTTNGGLSITNIKYINNRLYASGFYRGTFSIGSTNYTSTTFDDAAILKIDTTGALINQVIISSADYDFDLSLQLLPNASIIYIGHAYSASGQTTAMVSVGTNTITTLNDYDKLYFVKLDTSLNVLATKNINQNLVPYVVSHDLNSNIYLTASNFLANNLVDGVTIANTGSNILTINNNLNVIDAFKSTSFYVCADKDANLYTTTNSTSVTINGYGTSFTPSGPETWSQFQIKLGSIITNIGTYSKLAGATVYPNPSGTGLYNLKINESIKQKHNIVITITNTLGQNFNNIVYTIEDNQTLQVNLANFASGLYTITAIIDGKNYNAKLEKE
jgi:hypothetical protein